MTHCKPKKNKKLNLEAHQINSKMNKYQNLNVWKYQKGCWTKLRKYFSRQAMRWLIMNKNIPNFCFFSGLGEGVEGRFFWYRGFVPLHVLWILFTFSKCAQYVSNVLYVSFLTPYDLWTIIPLCYPQHSHANPMVVPNSSTFYSIFLAQNPTLV